MAEKLDDQQLRRLWEQALAEDGAKRDITSLVSVDFSASGTARIIARQAGVFAGRGVFEMLDQVYADELTVTLYFDDVDIVEADAVLATLAGPVRLLLGIERTLLNFLQRLCGVATLTRQYVEAVTGSNAKIYDTRKTIPGWRQLDKYAVRCGGGHNHRMGLHDAILIKDNHLAEVEIDSLAKVAFGMVKKARALNPPPDFVEFEVDTLDQLAELLKVEGIDVILLDNFTSDQMSEAVERRDAAGLSGKVQLEASGGVDLATVREIATTGIERIAIGALTHSAPALDIGMEIEPAR